MAGVLFGWSPDRFWQATPAELAAVLAALGGEALAMADRGDLARLEGMFPDG